MSLNSDLVRTIKANFAAKSSAQLKEIASDQTDETWSPEAVAAANELLQERQAGSAAEPAIPEPPRDATEYCYDPTALAIAGLATLLGGLFVGYATLRYFSKRPLSPDLPQPFGPRLAWLALDTVDTDAVVEAIGLRGDRDVTWADGIEEAFQSRVFVTPPLGDWTLVASTSLLPVQSMPEFVKPMLESLSGRFMEAQYFCTQNDLQLHAWAKARGGKLLRAHGWFGKEKLVLWNEGATTREERRLGLQDEEPDEEAVTQLASMWSVDPTTLDQEFKEPLPGRLGRVVWSKIATAP